MTKLDSFEAVALQPSEVEIKENMATMNSAFKSKLAPENGYYGVTESVKDDGTVLRVGSNAGRKFTGVYVDGQLNKTIENLGKRQTSIKYYDDKGFQYCERLRVVNADGIAETRYNLTPNSVINKGNFTSETDSLGRPVRNSITNLEIKEGGRDSLSRDFRTSEYRLRDQIGHLIPDIFGGPASRENLVPQFDKANLGKISSVENLARRLKEQGHTVDYEVKINYSGCSSRPTSFEPIIRIDGGSENQVPVEMRKIYNSKVDNPVKALVIDAGERFGGAHEVGVKSGLVSAGLAFSVSTAENLAAYVDGEISAEDMVAGIAGDTALAGVVGYGTTAAGAVISSAMAKSSESLIGKIGNSCLPASLVSFGVVSYNDVAKFINGETDAADLAYGLGSNAAGIAGSVAGGIAGTAAVGAVVGSTVGPVGTLAGTVVGGAVGCAVATGVYSKAVELGSEGAEVVADQASRFAEKTLDAVKEIDASSFEPAKAAVQEYFESWNLPFSFGEDKS